MYIDRVSDVRQSEIHTAELISVLLSLKIIMKIYSINKYCTKFSESLYTFFGDVSITSSAVVKALYYKPEGRGFEIRRGERIFSIYLIISVALGNGVNSSSNRHEYQKQINNVSGE
jgi:hypothetical protein